MPLPCPPLYFKQVRWNKSCKRNPSDQPPEQKKKAPENAYSPIFFIASTYQHGLIVIMTENKGEGGKSRPQRCNGPVELALQPCAQC